MKWPDEWEQPPDWAIEDLNFIRTAKFLGVKVWELGNIPQAWIDKAKFWAEIESRAGNIQKTSVVEEMPDGDS